MLTTFLLLAIYNGSNLFFISNMKAKAVVSSVIIEENENYVLELVQGQTREVVSVSERSVTIKIAHYSAQFMGTITVPKDSVELLP
jgi:hypothetical protein